MFGFASEKYAQVQQNPILPPAAFFLRRKNTEKVGARSSNERENIVI